MLDFYSRSGGRKTPQQARSRDMIDRILAAAAQVLAERGYAGLSTNRVAGRAGVSVGSLYRYFADKNELIEELRSRSSAEADARIHLAMGVALNACLRIALEPAPGISEDRLLDLTADLLTLGLMPAPAG
jgi:AcrR family transcriptional regulator